MILAKKKILEKRKKKSFPKGFKEVKMRYEAKM